MSQPAITPQKYLLVFGGLIVIVLATTFIGKLDLGPFNMPIALLFAAVKAALIVAFFMHVFRVTADPRHDWGRCDLDPHLSFEYPRGLHDSQLAGFPGK